MAPWLPEAKSDLFGDEDETMSDIRICEALHEAKVAFQSALVEGSAIHDLHFVGQLRQEPSYQIAEFFYLLRAFGLDSEEKIRRYAELHNRHLEALQADRAKMRRLGLSPTRLRKGVFTAESIPKLVENYRTGGGAIDQSDLARLLIEHDHIGEGSPGVDGNCAHAPPDLRKWSIESVNGSIIGA